MNTGKYKKPKIKVKILKLNFFMMQRFFDGEDQISSSRFNSTLLAQSCCSLCFLPDTAILMSDYSYKSIQDIKPGEKIISFDLSKQKSKVNTVAKLLVHPESSVGYYLINSNLKVTGNHRVWTNNHVWERVDQMKIGDHLLYKGNKQITVRSIRKLSGKNTVYNLHLDDSPHNYFAENVLAHNQEKS